VDWTLEVVVLPVSDIDRAVGFYRDKVGFQLDHDTRTDLMHVAQLTPPGSGCSIVIGDLPAQNEMPAGSMRGLQLVVPDAAAAREKLLAQGVEVSELMVLDAQRDGGTFFGFSDPDGNTWAVQELRVRASKPLIPVEHRGRFGADQPPLDAAAAAKRHPTLARLDALVGEWTVQPNVPGVGSARTEFSWQDGGQFLRQVSGMDEMPDSAPDAWRENAPSSATMIIGLDDSAENFTALYADGRGVHRVYAMTFDGTHWTMERRAPGFNQRFAATLDGDTINGRFELSEDGVEWNLDFEVTYRRR
jgi:catechol 2,3-dioxygenase-like lactoylglutathione lyase family enzyme